MSSRQIIYDICLLKTTEDISFNARVWPICLPDNLPAPNDGTYDKLVISNNEDASNSTRDPGITSEFYQIYDAKLLNAPSPDGFNKAFFTQDSSTTQSTSIDSQLITSTNLETT